VVPVLVAGDDECPVGVAFGTELLDVVDGEELLDLVAEPGVRVGCGLLLGVWVGVWLGSGLRAGFGDVGCGVGVGVGEVDDGAGSPGSDVGAAWAAGTAHASIAAADTATAVTRARTVDHRPSPVSMPSRSAKWPRT
jgi:hypothetical protein